MPIAKSQLDYWDGSNWVTAETPANNNALIRVTIDDKMGQAMECSIKLSNKFNNPFSASADDFSGKLSGIFTDFQRIRVLDSATKVVLFYGRIYKTSEIHDMSFGNVINIEAFDALAELKDMVTTGHDDINMTNSGDTFPIIASPTTAVGKRSGLIKGLISLFSKSGNITFASDSNRFTESATTFSFQGSATTGTYPLKKGGQKSALAHINATAKDDPHTSAKKILTHDYYVDPNFQSRATDHEPAAFFNYFKRGDRPSTTPATNGLRIEYPTGGGLTKTGRILPMMADYEFTRPKTELYTDAVCRYLDEGPDTVGGAANLDKGWDVEEKTVKLELIKVKTISGAFVWSGKAISGGTAGTDSAEEVKSGSTVVGRIQFISATSGGSDADPEYVLISDATSSFPASGTITGATSTSSSFVVISRLSDTYGINKTAQLGATNIDNVDLIREQALARLRRSSDSILRGRVRIMSKPWYYIDSSATTVASNTVTFGDLNPISFGFRIGMTVNKVSATGTVQAFGYATAVTSTTVTIGNAMSATISTGDTIRLYIPVRASDSCHIVNRLVNITGGDFQISEVNYTEDNGVISTELDVVGTDSGLGPPQNIVSRLASVVAEKENYTQPSGGTAQSAKVKLTSKFSQGAIADGSNPHNVIKWTAGQLTVGANPYIINAGTQVFSTDGEHYLFYDGAGGVTFSQSTVATYTTNKDHTIICWVNVIDADDEDDGILEFKVLVDSNISVPDMGNAAKILNPRTIKPTDKIVFAGMEYFNADAIFTSSGDDIFVNGGASTFSITFADGTSKTIAGISTGTATDDDATFTLGPTGENAAAGEDHFIYADISPTGNGTLHIDDDHSDAIGDSKILLATCERVTGKDALIFGKDSAASGGMSKVQKALDINGGIVGPLKQGGVLLSDDIFFQTAASGDRIEIVANGILGKNISNVVQFSLNASNGKGTFGGDTCVLDASGITLGTLGVGSPSTWLTLNSPVTSSNASWQFGVLGSDVIDSLLLMFNGTNNSHAFVCGIGDTAGSLGYYSESNPTTFTAWNDVVTRSLRIAAMGTEDSPTETGVDVEVVDTAIGAVAVSQLVKSSSSRRYKENIRDLVIDTSKIYDLVPRTFKWKDKEERIGKTDFGLIAEEVHEILPELVTYSITNEPETVRYKSIAVLLLTEMKKLRSRVEILEEN